MSFELSPRGFKHYEPVSTQYGHTVEVYESSAASEPCIWLGIKLTEEMARAAHTNIEPCEARAHMTLEQAAKIRDLIDATIAHHYQTETPE